MASFYDPSGANPTEHKWCVETVKQIIFEEVLYILDESGRVVSTMHAD